MRIQNNHLCAVSKSPTFVLSCIFAVIQAAMCGCSTPYVLQHDGAIHNGELKPDIRQNVVTIDNDGKPRDPVHASDRALYEPEFNTQIDQIFRAMDDYHSTHKPGGKKRILIFIHGGLNSTADSLSGADREVDQIKNDAVMGGYFPIFINWNSDLTDSYGEHLTSVTQGCKQYDAPGVRAWMSPLYLFSDFGRAISRIPVVWSHQISTDLSALRADYEALQYSKDGKNEWIHSLPHDNTRKVFLNLNQRYKQDLEKYPPGKPFSKDQQFSEMQISIGDDHITREQLVSLSFAYAVTSPGKFGLSWLLDGLGKPAWDNMSRRTQMPFDGLSGGNIQYSALSSKEISDAHNHSSESHAFLTKGALQVFVERLAEKIDATHGNPDYEVTLIGHSMGTMVLNEWIRRNENINYTNIVYMAAACTVRSFSYSIIPYLQKSPGCRFYNLTLHPESDLRERRRFDDIPPRGSLLVWIDDFLSDPQTPFDRTLGRWESLALFDNVLPSEIRGRITFKAMARNLDDNDDSPSNWDADPQTHGGFREKAYWRPSFWRAGDPRDESDPLVIEARKQAKPTK